MHASARPLLSAASHTDIHGKHIRDTYADI
jgi:hypothetical protein